MLSKLAARSFFVFCAFGIAAVLLIGVLFNMQILNYEKYQQDVIDNLTVETTEKADRGKIYDANMNLLATNTTAYRVFISPADIQSTTYTKYIEKCINRVRYGNTVKETEAGKREDEIIAEGLSAILGVDYDVVLEKTTKKGRRDETIKTNADSETAQRVREFISQYGFTEEIHVSAISKRYYCYDNLASHVIGFTGNEGNGLFGLESYYNEVLKGTDGRYITAQDAYGNDMPFDYESYFEAENGLNLITTIDMTIQYELEKQLQAALEDSGATDRVCGIVMDVNTGAILAMSVKPDFDLNDPYTLDSYFMNELLSSGLNESSAEYATLKNELRNEMWNNKCVNALYEPGSTFKVITSAMCLEEKTIRSGTYTCVGHLTVGGAKIHCWKHAPGHGALTFSQGLSVSCNPVLMQMAAELGADKFYNYFSAFGYLDKTGIDLPGESLGIFHSKNNLGTVELAVASFGQRFKTTPIQQITAISAVANGGYLVTPHLVKGYTDDEGNTIYSRTPEIKRQIVSSTTCAEISDILEKSVSDNGGGKNAYVRGYKIAAKTGTSEKLDLGGGVEKYIGTTVAYAPADDPQIAVLFIVDEPGEKADSYYGSIVAAPYCAKLFEAVLPYMGIEPNYTPEELEALDITLGNYAGYTPEDAKKRIESYGMKCEIIGEGTTVKYTIPEAGSSFSKKNGRVLLFTDNVTPASKVTVPDVMGKTGSVANSILINSGFNVEITGALNYEKGQGAEVVYQSVPAGTKLEVGSVITIELRHKDSHD